MRIRLKPYPVRTIVWAILLGIGSVLLGLFVEMPHGSQHWSASLMTQSLAWQPKTQDSRIAIVTISPTTLEDKPYLSPIDRELLANLISAIDKAGPKAIGLDILFDRPTEPDKDKALLQAVKEAKAPLVIGVVGKTHLTAKGSAYQAKFIADSGRSTGHVHFEEDDHSPLAIGDAVIRKASVLYQSGMPAMSLGQTMADLVRRVPQTSDYIYWPGPPKDGSEPFLTVPGEMLVGPNAAAASVIAPHLNDRFVLIGGAFPDRDQHLTPLSMHGERVPGVVIHAYILQQALDGRRLYAWDQFPGLGFFLIGAAIVGFAFVFVTIEDVKWPSWVSERAQKILSSHRTIEIVLVAIWLLITTGLFVCFNVVVPFTGVMLVLAAALAARHMAQQPSH